MGATWAVFEADQPRLAEAGRRLLYQHGPGLAYLATIRRDGGLLIEGVIVHTSATAQSVPAMQGSLSDAAGQDLRRWVFNPPVTQLAPGERANFRTEVRPVPPGVTRANVAFMGTP